MCIRDRLQAEAINTFVYTGYLYKDYVNFEEWLKVTLASSGQAIAIPADYITVPTVSGPGQYTYYGAGGLSWSTAYMALLHRSKYIVQEMCIRDRCDGALSLLVR